MCFKAQERRLNSLKHAARTGVSHVIVKLSVQKRTTWTTKKGSAAGAMRASGITRKVSSARPDPSARERAHHRAQLTARAFPEPQNTPTPTPSNHSRQPTAQHPANPASRKHTKPTLPNTILPLRSPLNGERTARTPPAPTPPSAQPHSHRLFSLFPRQPAHRTSPHTRETPPIDETRLTYRHPAVLFFIIDETHRRPLARAFVIAFVPNRFKSPQIANKSLSNRYQTAEPPTLSAA